MFLDGHSQPVIDLCVSPHDQRGITLATASEDCTARIWTGSFDDGLRSTKAVVGFEDAVVALAWDTRNAHKLYLSNGGSLFLFSLDTPKPLIHASNALETWKVSEVEINSIRIDRKSLELAWCDDSGAVGILNLSTGKSKLFRMKHANIASKVLYKSAKDGELLSASYDGSALIWDARKGTISDTLDLSARQSAQATTPSFVLSLASSEDGKRLATGAGNGSVWMSSTRLSNAREVVAHTGPVVGLAFADSRLLSCSLHQLCVWKENLEVVATTVDIKDLEKANCIAATRTHVFIGGFTQSGSGRVLVMPLEF
ncbi:hypothetical protein E3P81_01367 [Wallemia ichthyophaga]|nr:hypothetical protein E3P97_01368 [Wallemia ichthyophaga]TIB34019.1 hypothetical protein E3P85_01100 [Wallemia ichthyophaga]TIB48242.1 hypothetical protein E3P82_01366 [Wallemia ichthyophaga]TIB52452.1 hypothetical protein E3P81_01367 [Wallemia ichthyophaga]TIB55151.1 hypothetical protein E3P80_01367 [Wallemia ichthyophaga]